MLHLDRSMLCGFCCWTAANEHTCTNLFHLIIMQLTLQNISRMLSLKSPNKQVYLLQGPVQSANKIMVSVTHHLGTNMA